MGQVSSLFAHKVVGVACRGKAAARSRLLSAVGLDPDAPIDPKIMVPDDAYYALCERIARQAAIGPALSVRVGATMRCDEYGAFGLAWKTAVDLRGSYRRAERYGRVLTSVSTYTLNQDGAAHFMTLHRKGERRLGLRLSNEQTLVAVTQISREVSTVPFRPEAVLFRHPAPEDVSAHEAFFDCPVHFGADRDALQISKAALETPNRLGDQTVSQFFDAHLDTELASLGTDAAESGLERQVREAVRRLLSEGPPPIGAVASRLGMSGRSLQRRLSERGATYQSLMDAARRELAETLLRAETCSLAEVAFLTGFAEQSTFTRAFKRWRGETPGAYRLAVRRTAP